MAPQRSLLDGGGRAALARIKLPELCRELLDNGQVRWLGGQILVLEVVEGRDPEAGVAGVVVELGDGRGQLGLSTRGD